MASTFDFIAEKTASIEKGLKGKTVLSVSRALEQLVPEKDMSLIAEKTSKKHFEDQSSEYFHKSPEEVLDIWSKLGETGRDNGKKLDEFIELVLNKKSTKLFECDNFYGNEALKAKCTKAEKLIRDLENAGLAFEGREQKLFLPLDESTVVTGRYDALFSMPVGDSRAFYLIDWKNTEKILFENKFENMLGPCRKFPNANGYQYMIQVMFYRECLKSYGLKESIVPNIIQFTKDPAQSAVVYKPDFELSSEEIREILSFAAEKIKIKAEIAAQEEK